MFLTKEQIKKGLCAPTLIAIALAVMSIFGSSRDKMETLASNLVLIALLFALCYYGHTTAAWIVLIAPIFLALSFVALLIMEGKSLASN